MSDKLVVTTVIEIDKQFLHDVFVTAMEGGVDYWAELEKYKWSLPDSDFIPDLDGFAATIRDFEDDVTYTVNRDVILQGIANILHDKVNYTTSDWWVKGKVFAALAANDASNIDATLANVIVQAGLFSEIIC